MRLVNGFGLLGRLLFAVAIASVAFATLAGGDTRATLLIIALSLGVTGGTFIWIQTRLGTLSGMDKTLLHSGVPGSATITSVGETGITINNSPVIEFGLDVDVTVHAPYSTTIRQRVPRLLIGALLPGSPLTVRVDPTNREHLAIDWDEGVGAVTPAPSDDLARHAVGGPVVDAEHLLLHGRRATAIITAMEDAGDMSELGLAEVGLPREDDRLMILSLEVKQAGLDPYEVRVGHRVPERLVGRVGPRTKVDVAVDSADDHTVAIDWGSINR